MIDGGLGRCLWNGDSVAQNAWGNWVLIISIGKDSVLSGGPPRTIATILPWESITGAPASPPAEIFVVTKTIGFIPLAFTSTTVPGVLSFRLMKRSTLSPTSRLLELRIKVFRIVQTDVFQFRRLPLTNSFL